MAEVTTITITVASPDHAQRHKTATDIADAVDEAIDQVSEYTKHVDGVDTVDIKVERNDHARPVRQVNPLVRGLDG